MLYSYIFFKLYHFKEKSASGFENFLRKFNGFGTCQKEPGAKYNFNLHS